MTFYARLVEWSGWCWPLLANHLWQATLFFLLVLAISAPLKRAPARVRYSLWLAALAKFVIPSAAIAWLINGVGIDVASLFASEGAKAAGGITIAPFLSPVTSPPVVLHAVEPLSPAISPSAITYVATLQGQSYWYGGATLIWIVGCALMFGLWMRRRRLLSEAIWSGKIVSSGRELEILERVRSWLGLRRRVTLVISPKISEPGVWRILRPVIVLPEGIKERLDDGELETIMMHEMVHVERWDNLIGLLQRTVCCLLWFHPLVWLLDRELLAEREQSCDDAVIKMSGASEVYASGIRKVCRYSIGWELSGLSGAAGSNLKRRIKRIVAVDAIRSPSVLHRALLCGVAGALMLFSMVAGLIKVDEVTARNSNYDAVDPRFVSATTSAEGVGDFAASVKESSFKPPLSRQVPDTAQQIDVSPGASVVVRGEPEQIEPAAQTIPADVLNQQRAQTSQPGALTPAPSAAIPMAIIPASATRVSSSEFAGRYEVDPERSENFILDITLEQGELWLKPSHAPKRRLLRRAEFVLIDAYSEFRFTAIQDSRGRIAGLRLDSWSSDVTARKLALPPPSLKGATIFRLKGFPNARIVALAGSFNQWNQSQLLFAREGDEWVCRVNLPRGSYQYKFIVDGDWMTDPNNSNVVQDERGNMNSLLTAE